MGGADRDTCHTLQSAYPAFLMGGLCLVGGLTGFARTRSVPSLVAGVRSVSFVSLYTHAYERFGLVSVGLLFLWSADSIRKGTPNGLEGAFREHNSHLT